MIGTPIDLGALLRINKPTLRVRYELDEAAANATRVKSAGNAAGGGVLSEAGRYANMSDEDYMALALSRGADLS